jgi:hypothetical protein
MAARLMPESEAYTFSGRPIATGEASAPNDGPP